MLVKLTPGVGEVRPRVKLAPPRPFVWDPRIIIERTIIERTIIEWTIIESHNVCLLSKLMKLWTIIELTFLSKAQKMIAKTNLT